MLFIGDHRRVKTIELHVCYFTFSDGAPNAFVIYLLDIIVVLNANTAVVEPHIAEVTTYHITIFRLTANTPLFILRFAQNWSIKRPDS